MKATLRGFAGLGLLVGIALGAQFASAQSFNFPVAGFTTTNVCRNSRTAAPACQVLTDGSPSFPIITSGGVLRLTTANTNQHGAAWFRVPQQLSTGFTTAFQFQISKTNACRSCTFPADGMALVIQNDPATTGAIGYTGNGQNISYGNNDISSANGPGKAIKNSLAIELDTHQNSDYNDPDGNHIAVQSCGPNNASTLSPNSADHNYVCADGNLANLALQSLPSGISLTDTKIHTITVNYLPPGNCTSSCNNLSVYLDSALVLQATVDITKQLNLTANGSAYIGFTAATGSLVQNNDVISWSFSSLPLAPITITQPLQTAQTNFNYTPTLTAVTDYSQSGLGNTAFQGVFMQGTVQTITDQQFADLVNNTPFQGSTCQHQDTGSGNYACVVTTDLCTNPTSSTGSGANCPNTGTNALINVSNSYNLDPAQKPVIAPGYLMGKDNALGCGASADNTCKGLVNIFSFMSGDLATSGGRTNNFNSSLIPILGAVQPSTAATTSPALNNSWTNGNVTLTFNSTEIVPANNQNPPATLPTINSISYSASGANLPTPASGTLSGPNGSLVVPGTVEGTTVVTFFATDSAGTAESVITNDSAANTVNSASPTITINVDRTAPTFNCSAPAPAWQSADVTVPCTASDNANGSGLATPSSFNVSTSVPSGTETNTAQTAAGSVADVAGNTVPVPAYGPFWVDKKAPVISGPTISPASPTFGQSVTGNYSCADGGSGVVQCGPSGSGTIAATGSTGPLSSPADGTVGTHTFTVNAQDAVGNQSVASSITYTVAQATPAITWASPAPISYGTALGAAQLNATSSVAGTFVYTPPAGTVLSAGTQTLSVTFTPADTTNYTTAAASVQLVVTQAAPTLTWATPNAITYGTPLGAAQLNATANVAGTFVYSPAAGTVLGAGTQALSVTFTPTDATNYTTATASVSLLVNKATPIIVWTAPSPITYGTPLSGLQLNASANVSGTFAYSPAAGTILGAGVQTLSATFTPTDTTDYGTVTPSVVLIVNKATPVITWATPAPILCGTPLSSKQLNATANVPGTFAYNPPAGTVLAAGSRVLSVTFTPTDSVDYSQATAQVTILVTQPAISISPSSVNFGTVAYGKKASQTVTVSNVGNVTLNISNISISLGWADRDDFTFTTGCGSSLAPGASCSIVVTFYADDSGTRTATLCIKDNAPNSSQSVPLVGVVGKKSH